MVSMNPTPLGNIRVFDVTGGGNVIGTVAINAYSALGVPAYWRAINFLATNLASFPRSVHKDGARRSVVDDPHPLDGLLGRRPNGYQNATQFWRALFLHAAHAGNGFAEIARDARFRPVALNNLLPEDTVPFRYDRGDGRGPAQYYLLRSVNRVLAGADVIHLAGVSYDGMNGLNPVTIHTGTLERAATIERYQVRYLQRGTVIKGSVSIPQGVSDEQALKMVDTIRNHFSGANADRDILVLSDGATFNNATTSPEQSQLIEQATYTTKQIAQVTGVPPQFLYEFGESKYNNSIEQMGQDVVRYTFRPWLELTEDELTLKLLATDDQTAGYAVRLNPAALLRGDTTATTTTTVAQVNAGLVTRNEGRTVLEFPPDGDPDSDKLKTLGDTSPPPAVVPPTPPQQHAADRRPGGMTFAGQWGGLEGELVPLEIRDVDGVTTFAMNVHRSGAVGKAAAMANVPPGSTVETDTAAGRHAFAVGDHAPHAHPNLVTPALAQTSGPPLPGNPSPVHLGHVARMAAGSRTMGHEPTVIVRKPAAVPVPAYAALRPVIEAAAARVEAKSDKAFEAHGKKTGDDLTRWVNVFAEAQARYVADAFTPVADALVALGADRPDVAALGQRYAAEVRRRGAGHEPKPLAGMLAGPT